MVQRNSEERAEIQRFGFSTYISAHPWICVSITKIISKKKKLLTNTFPLKICCESPPFFLSFFVIYSIFLHLYMILCS